MMLSRYVAGCFCLSVSLLATLTTAFAVDRIGHEFRVNTKTYGEQRGPVVAGLKAGGFVALWYDYDYAGHSIRGQCFDASGRRFRKEMVITAPVPIGYGSAVPTVAGLFDGGFVVSWYERVYAGAVINAKRYDRDCTPASRVFHVSKVTWPLGSNGIVGLAAGGFVGVYSFGPYSKQNIYAHLFDGSGNSVAPSFRAEVLPSYYLGETSAVSSLDDGGFAIAWFDKTANKIYARRFGTTPNSAGNVILATSLGVGVSMYDLSIAGTIGGGFVAVYETYGRDGPYTAIYGSRFDSNNNRLGQEFRVGTFGNAIQPSVAGLADGSFVIAWTTEQAGSGWGVSGQRYDPVGRTLGSDFRINSFRRGYQGNPSIGRLEGGGFVVLWESNNEDGSGLGVYGQRFAP